MSLRNLVLAAVILISPNVSSAAQFVFTHDPQSVSVGDTFVVDVAIDTDDEFINALEGSIEVSANLEIIEARLRGSIVPLWLTEPEIVSGRVVGFAGILPGGFNGNGNAFTIVIRATAPGQAEVSVAKRTSLYLNDGEGTEADLKQTTYMIVVSEAGDIVNSNALPSDMLAPEEFVPEVISGEPFLIEGTVIVFAAIDKDSGILRYDVALSYNGYAREQSLDWVETSSPYILSDSDHNKYVYIRAIDRAGNTRVARVSPQEFGVRTALATWWILFLFLMLLTLVLWSMLRRQIKL